MNQILKTFYILLGTSVGLTGYAARCEQKYV